MISHSATHFMRFQRFVSPLQEAGFFDSSNAAAKEQRDLIALETLQVALDYLRMSARVMCHTKDTLKSTVYDIFVSVLFFVQT